jgi:hypothetical protein
MSTERTGENALDRGRNPVQRRASFRRAQFAAEYEYLEAGIGGQEVEHVEDPTVRRTNKRLRKHAHADLDRCRACLVSRVDQDRCIVLEADAARENDGLFP